MNGYDIGWTDIQKKRNKIPWYVNVIFHGLGAAAVIVMLLTITLIMLSIAEYYGYKVVPEISKHQYEK